MAKIEAMPGYVVIDGSGVGAEYEQPTPQQEVRAQFTLLEAIGGPIKGSQDDPDYMATGVVISSNAGPGNDAFEIGEGSKIFYIKNRSQPLPGGYRILPLSAVLAKEEFE